MPVERKPCGCPTAGTHPGGHLPTCLGEPYGSSEAQLVVGKIELGTVNERSKFADPEVTNERVKFAEPEPPRLKIPSRNELIARGFLGYLNQCTNDEEAVEVLTKLLDEMRSY